MKKRTIALLMAVVMLFGATVGGTIAWLTAQSKSVTNTFVVGNINIELDEAPLNADGKTINTTATRVQENNTYKMLPGNTLQKDPQVRVKAGSEACWLFVEVTESANFKDFLTYTIDSGWTPVPGTTNVYYREVASLVDATEDAKFQVIAGDTVTVKNTVTKENLDAFDTNKDGVISTDEAKAFPTVSFKAYAVQKENVADVTTAWSYVKP